MLPEPGLGQILDLLGRQPERHGAQVIAQALLFAAGGDGHDPLVDDPPESDLGLADEVLLRQERQQLVAGPRFRPRDRRQRTVGRRRDAHRLVEQEERRRVLQVRVILDLVDGWGRAGRRQDRAQVPLEEVGHPDRSSLARRFHTLHSPPGLL